MKPWRPRAWFLLAAALVAGLGSSARAQLPQEWHGTWKGDCVSFRQNGPPRQDFEMSLEVGPLEGSTALTWRTTYFMGEAQEPQVRDYRLLPTSQPGRFVVDERNGIQIDSFLVQGTLYQHFFLPGAGNSLMARWALEGDSLGLEIPGWFARQGSTTHGPGGIAVTSFPLNSLQRCSLTRQ